MQSHECTAALGKLNVHVALVGSRFDNKGMFTLNILFLSLTLLSTFINLACCTCCSNQNHFYQ